MHDLVARQPKVNKNHVNNLSPSLPVFPLPFLSGNYRFSIEMSDVTAAGGVELWLSTDSDPLNMRKILVLDYDDMVSGIKLIMLLEQS